jgi:hypothetical protein
MTEQQLAAVKQALAALEGADQIDVDMDKAITALQSIISQDALYKMAEDAVTIGLSYNDWPKIGCVNHDCDQCKAVQEPVAWMYDFLNPDNRDEVIRDWVTQDYNDIELEVGFNVRPLYTTPPAAQLVVPDGWKLVPLEPTKEMIDRGRTDNSIHGRAFAEACYRAMLAAAPKKGNTP